MKVIILAGGFGTRLGKKTEKIPKPMVKIGDKPIIWHLMKSYASYGYDEFVILLGYKGDIIKNYFKDIDEDWQVELVDTGLYTKKGGRLKRAEEYLRDDIHHLTYSDGLSDVNINEIENFHKSHDKMLTLTGVRPPARFGSLQVDGNLVTSFTEKKPQSGRIINGGFMVFDRPFLDELVDEQGCRLEKDVLEKLSKEGEIMVYRHKGDWQCMDYQKDLQYLNELYDEGEAFWKEWQ